MAAECVSQEPKKVRARAVQETRRHAHHEIEQVEDGILKFGTPLPTPRSDMPEGIPTASTLGD